MADHLRLPADMPLGARRIRHTPAPDAADRSAHAQSLRGILEGLETAHRGIFDDLAPDESDETDAADIGEIVLKFSGRFGHDNGPFKNVGMTPLAYTDGTQFFALSSAQSRSVFREYAQAYIDGVEDPVALADNWRKLLDRIEGVALYDVADRLGAGLEPPEGESVFTLDIALWPTSVADRGSVEEGSRRVRAVREMIEAATPQDRRVRVEIADDHDPDRLLLRATVNSAVFELLARHPYIEAIRGPLAVVTTQHDLRQAPRPDSKILPEGAPIGIIDDLAITANPWLTDVVIEQRGFPQDFDFGHPTRHGTHVAGFAAWGNVRALLDKAFDGRPHPVYVARVAQANDDYDPQIVGSAVEQVTAALDWFADIGVRVVVLAFTYPNADHGALISELSAAVDAKCREHDQVVVVSAGNLLDVGERHWREDYPAYMRESSSKLAAPATAALAVTVGSVAHSTALDRTRWPAGLHIAEEMEPAPFSRTGPARGVNHCGRRKPEFAAHGGSWGWDNTTSNLILDDPSLAAVALIPPRNNRLFGSVWGTSYAAPQVAHEIARIQTRYPDASANLLRALTALAGSLPPQACDNDTPIAATYGVPNADQVLESGGNRVVFVYEGTLQTNSHTVLEIPIPEEFAAGATQRELTIALAFDPPTRRSRRDYLAGRMHFDFHQKESLDTIVASYATQPTQRKAAANSRLTIHPTLAGVNLRPPKTHLAADTLICRSYNTRQRGWDVDDGPYYLVITHEHNAWTESQKKRYAEQRFAVAVRIHDRERTELDLYSLARSQLQTRARARGGGA